jgi:acrylyl-CoA reductase (NADPH)
MALETKPYRALVVREAAKGAAEETLAPAELPPGDLTVAVRWSSLNYKDALAVTGKGKVVRKVPVVPGIDLAGTVVDSAAPGFAAGDEVLVTGYGIGESHPGGLAELARVKAAWALPVPKALGARRAMVLGTAGLTSALCVEALEEAGVKPGGREVLVTGAAGGVGSVAVALLARAGFRVAASTGRPEERAFLEGLGAARIVERSSLARAAERPLESETWDGAVDAVGGQTLATVLRQAAYGGAVAACGLAGGAELPTTVLPFILRAVRLIGIDSVLAPRDRRERAWARLSAMPAELVDGLATEIRLDEVRAWSERLLAGGVRGRVVVKLGA